MEVCVLWNIINNQRKGQLQRISPSAGDQVQLNIWIEFYISFKKLLNTLHACTLSNRVFIFDAIQTWLSLKNVSEPTRDNF